MSLMGLIYKLSNKMTKIIIDNEINIKTKPVKFVAVPIGFDEDEYDKEYLTVKQISELTNQSTRNVRRIIFEIKEEEGPAAIHKDGRGDWRIHEVVLSRFERTRKKCAKYYALTINPYYNHSESELHEIMKFVFDNTKDDKLEINYVIERTKAKDLRHLHCFVKCNGKRKLIESIRLGFSRVNYHQSDIFDFEGWRTYITKDNDEIKTIKKTKI